MSDSEDVRPQRTIARPAEVQGVGLHSGQTTTVRVKPAPPDTGVVFVRTDVPGYARIPALISKRTEVPLRTALANEGQQVHTIEHLLSAAVGLGVADQPSGTADLQATALTAATLRFQRTGSDVTVTATAADATASITGTSNAATLQLGVQLGSNMGAVTGDTRAVIDGFVVTGAGVTSDTFDCDSLLPQL